MVGAWVRKTWGSHRGVVLLEAPRGADLAALTDDELATLTELMRRVSSTRLSD